MKFWVNDAKDHAEKNLKIEAMAGICLHHQQKMFGEGDERVYKHMLKTMSSVMAVHSTVGRSMMQLQM